MSPKKNTAEELIERTLSLLNEIVSKSWMKMKKVIERGNRSKTLTHLRPVESAE